jgi:predicted phage-related endonuclease
VTTMLTPLDREWHERRLDGFGGSEVGALLGISPYATARTVVERKARRIIQDPTAPERLRLRMGRELEPILLEHLWETLDARHGSFPRPRRSGLLWRMPGHDFVTSDVDGFIGDALAECKTDEYGALPWGDPDGEPARVVPAPYYAQVQQGMAATTRKRAFVIVLIGLHEERVYEVPRRDEYIADLVEVEAVMWAQVLAIRERLANDPDAPIEDLLPALEGTELTDHLKATFPRSDEVIRSATAEQEEAIRALRAARVALAAAESVDEHWTAAVQDAIKDAAGITSPEGTITWRTSKDGEKVAWDLVSASYRTMLREAGTPEDRLDAVRTLYTTSRPGSRTFLVPRAWTK